MWALLVIIAGRALVSAGVQRWSSLLRLGGRTPRISERVRRNGDAIRCFLPRQFLRFHVLAAVSSYDAVRSHFRAWRFGRGAALSSRAEADLRPAAAVDRASA